MKFNKLQLVSLKNNVKAFTLVELLVAITIFAVFISVLAGSYLKLSHSQRDINETRKVYSEGRFLLDEMISDIRGSKIDYSCYRDDLCDSENDSLALINPDGKRVIYFVENTNDNTTVLLKKLIQIKDNDTWKASSDDGYFKPVGGGNGSQIINLDTILIDNLRFDFTDQNSNDAKKVSIFMSLRGTSQIREDINFDVQTTVSLREY